MTSCVMWLQSCSQKEGSRRSEMQLHNHYVDGLCEVTHCVRDVKLVFFHNRSSSRDNQLLTDHRNQDNSSGHC